MAVIAGYSSGGSLDTHYIASVKGAPEALKSMFSTIPANYDEVYLALSRKGSRVLAVGYRNLGVLSHQVILKKFFKLKKIILTHRFNWDDKFNRNLNKSFDRWCGR